MLLLTTILLTSTLQSTGALTFTAPSGWQTRAAASTMRVAEFLVPAPREILKMLK